MPGLAQVPLQRKHAFKITGLKSGERRGLPRGDIRMLLYFLILEVIFATLAHDLSLSLLNARNMLLPSKTFFFASQRARSADGQLSRLI